MKTKHAPKVEVRIQKKVKRCCEWCDAKATKKLCFLTPNYRNNPASSAYGRDDCSWCSDYEAYTCDKVECISEAKDHKPEGFIDAAVFHITSERFKHMAYAWEEISKPETLVYAAAPDLLKAAEYFISAWKTGGADLDSAESDLYAAIGKAKGEEE